ncbi:YbgA family protein [Candidatus Omnitrophota bacterium]
MSDRVKVGISKCLLGEKVRYDGGHKLDRFLRDTLGQFVEWVPVCPEAECGLPIPREAMRLVGDKDNPRLMTQKTGIDHTERMMTWAKKRVKELAKEDLCGYVFKTGSPSSGMRDIKIYNEKGNAIKHGVGMFARVFMDAFPLMPFEDEGRLHDPGLREKFIERLFVFKRWQDMLKTNKTIKGLVDFHTEHKLLIMAHSPKALSVLGKMVADAKGKEREALFSDYMTTLLDCLKLHSSVKKNTNVLQHILGYFKKDLTADEKQEALEVISEYHKEYVPLIVPIVLLQHYVRKYDQEYLKAQHYLHPHPIELMLRNHV